MKRRNLILSAVGLPGLTATRGLVARVAMPSVLPFASIVGVSTALVIPSTASAFVPNGVLFATSLLAIFGNHGLRERHVSGMRAAPDIAGRRTDGFHGTFDDESGVDFYQRFKFENGKITGVVNNKGVGGRELTHRRANIDFNKAEVRFAANEKTLHDYGSLLPQTTRTPVGPDLADALKSASRKRVEPLFARGWSTFEQDEPFTVVVGKTSDGVAFHVVPSA